MKNNEGKIREAVTVKNNEGQLRKHWTLEINGAKKDEASNGREVMLQRGS